MSRVWRDFPHGGSRLLVMLALADYASDDGTNCRPSIAALARKCRLSRSQAQRVVHDLIEVGALKVIGNHDGGARGDTRQYQIVMIALGNATGSADATPTGRTDATGSVYATGRTHAIERVAPMRVTGSTGATQSIKNHHEPLVNTPSECLSPHGSATRAARKRKAKVPYQQILGAYHTHFPSGPRVSDLSEKRKTKIAARWQEVLDGRYHPADKTTQSRDPAKALLFFERYFDFCEKLDWCSGRRPMNGSTKPWVAKIDNLMGAEFMAKRSDEACDGREGFRS
jgi:hypothetical protein